ncbi:class II aldolase/adducin family protein, partial [Methyloceanibacter sp.]|uniref:class II aldolase/adducin family protein n=1 Tax=Methyloceanibacter sp. TaxID=1965321 RepID=UPI003D6CE58D
CILRNHGLLTVGRSVEESIGWFVMAERVAEVHVKAPNGRPISDEAAAVAASTLAPDPVGWRMFQWGPAIARSRSIGGRLNSAPGQVCRRQTDESMVEVALAIVQWCRHRSPRHWGAIVRTFLGLGSEGPICNGGKKFSAIRREYKNRDDAIRVAYESGAYGYQQIAKEFEVHFTTVGRIVRRPKKRVSVIPGRR